MSAERALFVRATAATSGKNCERSGFTSALLAGWVGGWPARILSNGCWEGNRWNGDLSLVSLQLSLAIGRTSPPGLNHDGLLCVLCAVVVILPLGLRPIGRPRELICACR